MMSSSYTKSTSAISFPTGEYNDKYVDLKQYVSRLEQGFSVNNIDAFIGAKDTRINERMYLQSKESFVCLFRNMNQKI